MSCDSSKQTVTASTAANPKWEVVLQKAHGGPEDAKFIIAQEPSIVADFYKELNTTISPAYAVPEIDYSKEQLLLLCMGQKHTGGYAIEVTDMVKEGNTLTVLVKETTPEPGAMVTSVLTNPFCIVKMPHTDDKIVFKRL